MHARFKRYEFDYDFLCSLYVFMKFLLSLKLKKYDDSISLVCWSWAYQLS